MKGRTKEKYIINPIKDNSLSLHWKKDSPVREILYKTSSLHHNAMQSTIMVLIMEYLMGKV